MLRFLCKKCGKRMKVTDDDVGRKIRCPACSYSTAVPPIKVNAKTYHFEYSVCDSLNVGSAPGRNAPGMPAPTDLPGDSLGGVTYNAPSSSGNKELPENFEIPVTPSYQLPLRAGAKLAPTPKDPVRYQAAIAAARTRTASIRLRPGMQGPPPPPPIWAVQPPLQPEPLPDQVPEQLPEPQTIQIAPEPTPEPTLPEPVAPAPAPKPQATPPAPARAQPVVSITQDAQPTGPVAPSPQDALRYQAALAVSRNKTALLRQQVPDSQPQHEQTQGQVQPADPAQALEPLLSSPSDTPQDAAPAEEESQAPRPDRPESPTHTRRPTSPVEPEPEPQPILDRPDRPEAPSIPRPEAPQRRAAVAGTGYVPRPGMPRPIITKAVAPETVFTDAPDNTPLPVSGKIDPAAQALAQMAQYQTSPSNPINPPTPGGASGPISSYDPAEALRQLAIAASGTPPDEDADADALTGLARYTTVDARKSPPKPPAKPAQAPAPAQGSVAPLPADPQRYQAALAPSREKTRQSSGE